jgi:membrane protein DedA with SNARE-associated domain
MGELPAIYRWTENAVEKAGSVALVLMPGSNIVCLLLGHKRMDPRRFVPLLCIGIAIKLAVLWRGGQIFAEEIKSFLNWIEKYQWYVVMALFALSMLQSVRKGQPQQK